MFVWTDTFELTAWIWTNPEDARTFESRTEPEDESDSPGDCVKLSGRLLATIVSSSASVNFGVSAKLEAGEIKKQRKVKKQRVLFWQLTTILRSFLKIRL